MSLPEVLLWRLLKQSDLKFRRQHPVGPFVLDFYCPKAKLGIEIDGATHDNEESARRDAARDAIILGKGIRIIRIPCHRGSSFAGRCGSFDLRGMREISQLAPPPPATRAVPLPILAGEDGDDQDKQRISRTPFSR